MFRSISSALIGALVIWGTSAVRAQDDADSASVAAIAGVPSAAAGAQAGWRNQFGIGVIANPKFVGSDEYNVRPIPYLDLRYFDAKGARYFANVPQGLGGYLYRSLDPAKGSFLRLGAALAPGFNVRDDSIDGLDEVGVATEARLYLETGGRNWVATATLAQDVGSGHEGAYLDLGLALRGRFKDPRGFYAVGPVLRLGDKHYKDSLFGVTPQDSDETGLPAYTADAGVERLGLQGLVSVPLGQSKWRVTGLLRASQLIDNAADSPIIVDETQLFFLTALTRSF
ncbi:MAG: MipA/OmpV family protein [Pseudomonadota bacterium]